MEFLTRPFAGVALPAAGQATPERPTAAPYGRGARPPMAGRFVGLSGPQQPCPAPARPRAPLTACGGKARANNRGLAKEFLTGTQNPIGLKTLSCASPIS